MKPGDIFEHKFWMELDNSSLVCKVTRLAHGGLYYRPQYKDGKIGKSVYIENENTDRYVGRIL